MSALNRFVGSEIGAKCVHTLLGLFCIVIGYYVDHGKSVSDKRFLSISYTLICISYPSADMSNGAVDNPLPSMDGYSCFVLS